MRNDSEFEKNLRNIKRELRAGGHTRREINLSMAYARESLKQPGHDSSWVEVDVLKEIKDKYGVSTPGLEIVDEANHKKHLGELQNIRNPRRRGEALRAWVSGGKRDGD